MLKFSAEAYVDVIFVAWMLVGVGGGQKNYDYCLCLLNT